MSVQEDVWGWLHPALQDLRSTAGQSWDERRARFLEQLGLADPAEQPAVAALLHWLDELPDEERATTLDSDQLDATAYELVQTPVSKPDDQHASGDGYDEQAWHTFLATNGPSWDGAAESWPAFRQWFEYHAAEQGLATAATALLEFLESQPASDRVATFASYGVTIATPAAQPAQQAQAASAGAHFDWVTAEQSAALAGIFGGDWQIALAAELRNRWGAEWHTHPAEHKTAWLDDLIKSGQLEKKPEATSEETAEEVPAELAEIMEMINKLPSADQLDAELAGIPEAAEEEHAGLDELDELDADSNA